MFRRRDHDELVVIKKTYDLILWSCRHTGKFLRKHRFGLATIGERLARSDGSGRILIRSSVTTEK